METNPTFCLGHSGDADEDIFLTNKIDSGVIPRSGLYFYRNNGTAKVPVYTGENPGFLKLEERYGISLCFGDLDADGDQDLLAGDFTGTLSFYENQGSPKTPNFILADSAYMEIDVGQKSTPILADLDGDGDLDLLIGEARGLLKHYRNDGKPEKAQFTLLQNRFQGIEGPIGISLGIGDLDGDSDLDLVVGGDTGIVQLWLNSGNRTEPKFLAAIPFESPFSFTPSLSDADGDGDLDLFGGSFAGGLVLFENNGILPKVGLYRGIRRARFTYPRGSIDVAHFRYRIVIAGKGEFNLKGARTLGKGL